MVKFFCAGRGCTNASLRLHHVLMLCALAFLCLSILCLGVFSNFDALATNNIAYASSSDGIVVNNEYPINYFEGKNYSATSSSIIDTKFLFSQQYIQYPYLTTAYFNWSIVYGSVSSVPVNNVNQTFVTLNGGGYIKGSTTFSISNSANTGSGVNAVVPYTYSVYVTSVNGVNVTCGNVAATPLVDGVNTFTASSGEMFFKFTSTLTSGTSSFVLHWIKCELGSEFTGYVPPSYTFSEGMYNQTQYDSAYTNGYNAGESAGYQDGYDAGYDAGVVSSDGYDAGYDAGYDVGYDAGWDAGSERSYIDNLPLALYIPNQQYAEFGEFLNTSAFTYDGVSYSGDYSDQSFEINDVYRYEFTADSGDAPGIRFTSSFTGSIFNVSFGVDTHAWYNSLRGVLFRSINYSYYYDLASNNAVFSSIADSTRRCTYYSLSVSGLSLDSYYIYILFDNSILTGDYYMGCLVLPYSVSCDSADNSLTLQQVYEQGYNDGVYVGSRDTRTVSWQEGYSSGYGAGYNDGVEGADYTFLSLFGAVIDAPIQAFNGLFNFEILGVNMRTFLLAILTLSIGLFIWKIIVRGG